MIALVVLRDNVVSHCSAVAVNCAKSLKERWGSFDGAAGFANEFNHAIAIHGQGLVRQIWKGRLNRQPYFRHPRKAKMRRAQQFAVAHNFRHRAASGDPAIHEDPASSPHS